MFDFLKENKYGLLLTNEEIHLKKIKMLALIFMLIGLVFLYKTINIYTTNLSIDKTFESMDGMDRDSIYNFLYFDKSLSEDMRKNYENFISLQPEIAKSLSKNKIRILVSDDDIKTSFSRLSKKSKTPVNDSTVGIFVKEYRLILLKPRNPKTITIKIPENTDNEKANELLSKNIKSATLGELYNDKELYDLELTMNKTVLFHEIGHYLDEFSKNKLDYNFNFYKAYLTERNSLFMADDKYNVSNVSEYIAQSVSYYLVYGSVEGKNNMLEPNTTETSKYIGNLINEYKNIEGGEN